MLSLAVSVKFFVLCEYLVNSSSLILNSVPSEVMILSMMLITFSGGGCGGGGCAYTFFLAPIKSGNYKIRYHSLLA